MVEETAPEAPEPTQTESIEGENDSTRAEFEEALREKDQFKAMAQRAQADLINYRRRAEDEREEIRRSANTGLILKVLNVFDDLGRAVAMVPEDAIAPGWLEGLELVQRNLQNLLDAEGITKIEAEGRPFEPWEHEALLYEETDECEEGLVISVIRDGYRRHDRVLRPAQVSVAKAPAPATPAEPETTESEATESATTTEEEA